MKKVAVAAAVIAVGGFVSVSAHADTDVFGTQQQLDGSYELRQTTTEQFDPVRGQSVLARPRPDFDAIPIAVDSFNVFPTLDFGAAYNSNIFTQPTNHDVDEIMSADPGVVVQSNWNRHAVALTATGDLNYYYNKPAQDFNAATVQAEGRYDLGEKTWLAGTGGYQRVTELRGNPATPASQAGPSQYNLYTASGEYDRNVGIIQTKAAYNVANYNYDDIDLIGGGQSPQGDRNRTQNEFSGEVSYNAIENLKPYAAVAYNWRDYTNSGMRDSNGYKADLGARMDWGGVTTAQAYVGFMQQDYFNFAGQGPVSAVDFGADVLWNVTTLTSIEGKAGRSIEEATTSAATSYVNSTGSVTVSHELMRNVILEGNVAYNGIDWQGINEHDDYYNVGGGARYFFNRNLHTDLTYNYQRKESDAPGLNFDQHVVMVRVGLQY